MAPSCTALHCSLSEELCLVQAVVDSLLLEELTVCAYLCHHTTHDHSNLVSILVGGQVVGNHSAGTALLGTVQSLLDNLKVQDRTVEDTCTAMSKRDTPSCSLCPEQKWLHPGEGSWGPSLERGQWQCAASVLQTFGCLWTQHRCHNPGRRK